MLLTEENKTLAAFVDADYRISDSFEIGAGIRYDNVHRDQAPVLSVERSATFIDWQPQLTLRYYASDDSMFYARVARGFRPGGFNNTTASVPVFDSETLQSYELGVKASLLEGALDTSFNVYYIDEWKPQIQSFLPNTDPSGAPFIASTATPGTAESYGFEGSITAAINTALKLQSSFGYNKTEMKEDDPVVPSQIVEKGDPIPFAPEWNFNLSLVYHKSLGDNLDLEISPSVSLVGETYYAANITTLSGPGADMIQDPHERVNLSVSLLSQDWDVTLYGHNLTNEEYLVAGEDLSYEAPGSGFFALGDLRSYGVKFKYRM
ncbi:TonB-dependent receptor [Pseudomaricurvus alkylphenolicus]|nr:TonB-dependent receptor [Pseudomaricurvus alkylphenolicus]